MGTSAGTTSRTATCSPGRCTKAITRIDRAYSDGSGHVLQQTRVPTCPARPLSQDRGRHRQNWLNNTHTASSTCAHADVADKHAHNAVGHPRRAPATVFRDRQPPRDRSPRQPSARYSRQISAQSSTGDHSPNIERCSSFRPELPAHFSTGADSCTSCEQHRRRGLTPSVRDGGQESAAE